MSTCSYLLLQCTVNTLIPLSPTQYSVQFIHVYTITSYNQALDVKLNSNYNNILYTNHRGFWTLSTHPRRVRSWCWLWSSDVWRARPAQSQTTGRSGGPRQQQGTGPAGKTTVAASRQSVTLSEITSENGQGGAHIHWHYVLLVYFCSVLLKFNIILIGPTTHDICEWHWFWEKLCPHIRH